MEQKKDIRYSIKKFIDNKDIHRFNSLKNQIDIHGFFVANHVKIYTSELALFFCQDNEIPLINLDKQKEETINTYEYLKTYIEAYKEGEKYFEENFKVSPNIIYGENAKTYVEDLKLKYNGAKNVGTTRGWKFVKETYPTIVTHEEIKRVGYHSGIVSKLEEQVNKYPKLFATFENENNNINHYKIIDEAFTKFKEEIFKILNSEPIKLDTLEQDVRTFTVNAKDFISKYHKIALNDTSLMIDFTKQVNELSFIIEQLVKSTFDASYQNKTNKPQQWFGIHGINATTLLLEFNIFIDTLFIKDSTTSKEPQQETKTDAPTKKEYNSSQFNDHTYKLFCHIVDEYKKDGNIKFINIWYFLKRDIDKTKYKNILFNFTQTKYKEFVKKYDVEIKKFKKADFKYKDDEVGILQNITNDYYTSLKEIENT